MVAKIEINSNQNANFRAVERYSNDLTEKALNGELDPVVGRDRELKKLIRTLSRRTKANPILVGDAGVGKTAIVESLATAISIGNVPDGLKGKRLMSLDLAMVTAGSKYRGEFEERIRSILADIKRSNGKILLFIDEFHHAMGDINETNSICNIMKPALARREVSCIASTTIEEYRRFVEPDAALARRFQPIIVNEPDTELSIAMLMAHKTILEQFYNISIQEEAVEEAVKLTKRYIGDRKLPDKALDLLDESLSYVCNEKYLEKNSCSAEIKKLGIEDINHVLAEWTGIPKRTLKKTELQRLKELPDRLEKVLFGQSDAVTLICRSMLRHRLNYDHDDSRPLSLLLVGPSSVGKSFSISTLVKLAYAEEMKVLHFDMSELAEKHTISRLFGAPPGYVGYEQRGELTEAVRRQPYNVILFSGIETCHPDTITLIRTICETGFVKDGHGIEVDFRSCVLALTSNIGDELHANLAIGFTQTSSQSNCLYRDRLQDKVKNTFGMALLEAMDVVVPFDPLNSQALYHIGQKYIDDLKCRMSERNVYLKTSNSFLNWLKKLSQTSKSALHLEKQLQQLVEEEIIQIMVNQNITGITSILVDCEHDSKKLIFCIKN